MKQRVEESFENPNITGESRIIIERIGEDNADSWFTLKIDLAENIAQHSVQPHELERFIERERRGAITFDHVVSLLREWQNAHPELTITEFWVLETRVVQQGRIEHGA